MNKNWKVFCVDTDTGQARFLRMFENMSEKQIQQRIAGFNRIASKCETASSWAYCYVPA